MKASRPRRNAEPVNERTSQFSATFCIQVPMLDVHEPKNAKIAVSEGRQRPAHGASSRRELARRLRFQILVKLEWNQPRKFKPLRSRKSEMRVSAPCCFRHELAPRPFVG